MTDIATVGKRPLPSRPPLGWLAWEATLGYISAHHSPDATLKLEVLSGQPILWNASVVWGTHKEVVTGYETVSAVLADLWLTVEAHHVIFNFPEAAIKRPTNYKANEWLDERSEQALSRLIQTTNAVFADWALLFIYRPIEVATLRTQSRLIASQQTVTIAGSGPTLFDACVSLYQHATPAFAQHRKTEFIQRGDNNESA